MTERKFDFIQDATELYEVLLGAIKTQRNDLIIDIWHSVEDRLSAPHFLTFYLEIKSLLTLPNTCLNKVQKNRLIEVMEQQLSGDFNHSSFDHDCQKRQCHEKNYSAFIDFMQSPSLNTSMRSSVLRGLGEKIKNLIDTFEKLYEIFSEFSVVKLTRSHRQFILQQLKDHLPTLLGTCNNLCKFLRISSRSLTDELRDMIWEVMIEHLPTLMNSKEDLLQLFALSPGYFSPKWRKQALLKISSQLSQLIVDTKEREAFLSQASQFPILSGFFTDSGSAASSTDEPSAKRPRRR
jgi:hypothetical protein